MSKFLSKCIMYVFLLAPHVLYGMEPEIDHHSLVKIEDKAKSDLRASQQKDALKNMIDGQVAPSPTSTELQFQLLLNTLHHAALSTEFEDDEEGKLIQQLQQLVVGSKFDDPLLVPQLKDLWHMHPAQQWMKKGLTLAHRGVFRVIESKNGMHLISCSRAENTIKIWDKNNLVAEPISLYHFIVEDIIEDTSGNLFSWSFEVAIKSEIFKHHVIKIWDENNLQADHITLQHKGGVTKVIEAMDGNFISLSRWEGSIKVWNKAHLTEPISLHHVSPGVRVCSDGDIVSWSEKEGTIKVLKKIDNFDDKLNILQHQSVYDVIESNDSKKFISISLKEGTIKIWDKNNLTAEPITLQHPYVSGVIESGDGNLISRSWYEGTIKLWDASFKECITLQHPSVSDLIESMDGNFISWSENEGTIKIWDRNNLATEPLTLEHPGVRDVRESKNGKHLMSKSGVEGTLKIWDKNNFHRDPFIFPDNLVRGFVESMNNKMLIVWSSDEGAIRIWDSAYIEPTPGQICLLLAVYYESEGKQKFELPGEKISELKATFNTFTPITQTFLERKAPHFIAAIKSAQK